MRGKVKMLYNAMVQRRDDHVIYERDWRTLYLALALVLALAAIAYFCQKGIRQAAQHEKAVSPATSKTGP
jgi:hypothetical protein